MLLEAIGQKAPQSIRELPHLTMHEHQRLMVDFNNTWPYFSSRALSPSPF